MIIFFSGTGNSRYVASELSCILADTQLIDLRGETLAEGIAVSPDPERPVVWVMPVYSWGLTPVVEKWIERHSKSMLSACNHLLVLTCGDDVGRSASQWRKLLNRVGWNDKTSVWSVQMPNNYVLMKGFDVDSKAIEQQKLSACHDRIAEIAVAISKMPVGLTDVVKGGFAWFKSGVIKPWFHAFGMSPKPFHASNACVGCGLCAKNCPTTNIAMVGQRPRWSDNCALCLSCYHVCPCHAVQYGKATKNKGQYICPLTSAKNC